MNNTLKNCIEIELDDHSLVRMAQSGDSNSFSMLVQRHHAHSLSLALSILHDLDDAEDEVQNAFLNAFKHIREFRLDAQFSTWLSRIVMNQCRAEKSSATFTTTRLCESSPPIASYQTRSTRAAVRSFTTAPKTSSVPSTPPAANSTASSIKLQPDLQFTHRFPGRAVTSRTGLNQVDSEKRVLEVITSAKQSAETARKIAAHTLLWVFIALLIGAFCASYAATIGGRQRDHVKSI